jgi:predicted protein tyrosine phosphatase
MKDLRWNHFSLDRYAEIPVSTEMIEWADIIFVMEKSHRNKLSKNFQPFLKNKKVICLDIPDDFSLYGTSFN